MTSKAAISNVEELSLGRRRTKRLAVSVSLEVSGEDLKGASFRLTAKATNLNRDGGMLRLNRDVSIGSRLLLKHRGLRASARVVRQAIATEGQAAYGIEFIDKEESSTFWGIHFPSTQHPRK